MLGLYNPVSDLYPMASQQDVAGFGLGGVDYGDYQPTDYASKVAGATGQPNQGLAMLAKALGGMGGGGAQPQQRHQQLGDFSMIAPQMLDPVMKQRALVQALLGGGNG